MRPVERGEWPQRDGRDKEYAKYQDALPDLCDRIGPICSYCERVLPCGVAVEHKLPRGCRANQHLERSWTNFLVSCVNCNSAKGATVIDEGSAAGYLWPDLDNTAFAFLYQEGGVVEVNPRLAADQVPRARALCALVGLDRHQFPPFPDPSPQDRRWSQRSQVWDQAARARDNLLRADSDALRETVRDLARHTGFFSVWMSVFGGDLDLDRDMRRRLLNALPGTAILCFDDAGRPLAGARARPTT